MKIITTILVLAGLLACWSCNDEEIISNHPALGNEVGFSSTLLEGKVESRAATDPIPLPYINGIRIKKVDSKKPDTIAYYHVKNANKGTLEKGEKEGETTAQYIKWEDRQNEVDFYAWTTPSGVTFTSDDCTDGTVDFVTGNTKGDDNEMHKIDGTYVSPLEVFIGAYSKAKYTVSPTVSLPFTHLVSKLSIRVRDWNNASITPTSITFYGVNEKWNIKQGENVALAITGVNGDAATKDIKVEFKVLNTEKAGNDTYHLIYLPPLTEKFGTDFAAAGDFCIVYGEAEGGTPANYYGSLNTINEPSELQAGEHLRVTMDLSKNFGVGVGVQILDWQGPDGEETIYGRPHRGIYSSAEFMTVVNAINSGKESELPDSLIESKSPIKISLYNDIAITGAWSGIGNKDNPFTGTFDGLGHTVSGINGTTGLFGVAGNGTANSTTIQNIRLSGSVTGAADATDGIALLIDTANHATVSNCHVIGSSSVTASAGGIAGGLIGIATATSGTTLSQCSFTGTITGATIGGLVGSSSGASIDNCFVQETGTTTTTPINLVGAIEGGTVSLNNSYSVLKKTGAADSEVVGYYWKAATTLDKEATFNQKGTFITPSPSPTWAWKTLIEALNANVGTSSSLKWVYVYGKDFPVLQVN